MANLPVPSPRTFVPGEVEAAAYFNAIRDALTFLLKPPQARLHQASVQTLANNVLTMTAFDSTDVDTYGGHSNVTNNTRYVFQVAGTYTLLGGCSWTANTTGFRQLVFRMNGSTSYRKTQVAPSPSFETALTTAITLPVAAGDYVELGTWQNSGASLSTVVADQSVWPWMDIFRISS